MMECGLIMAAAPAIMGALWLTDSWIYSRILQNKAKPNGRTAEKIGAGFYYIVPEREYVEMEIAAFVGRAALAEKEKT